MIQVMVIDRLIDLFLTFILLFVSLLLVSKGRDWLFQWSTQQEEQEDNKDKVDRKYFPQLSELAARETAFVYFCFVSATLIMMFIIATFEPIYLTAIMISITLVLIFSYWLILNMQKVLSTMRGNKQLSFSFWFAPDVLGMVIWATALEFGFLYWIKEVTTYFLPPFQWFVIFYSLLILVMASYLGLRTKEKQFLKNSAFISVVVLDSIIITLLINLYLQITLAIIYSSNLGN